MHRVAEGDFTPPALEASSGDGIAVGPTQGCSENARRGHLGSSEVTGPAICGDLGSGGKLSSLGFPAGEHPAMGLFSEPVKLICFLGEFFCDIASCTRRIRSS